MSELANKAAQEAYVNSLYRMTQEQLIAEVMRVQMAAADLIKAEVETERDACVQVCESLFDDEDSQFHYIPDARGALKEAVLLITARGNKVITQ